MSAASGAGKALPSRFGQRIARDRKSDKGERNSVQVRLGKRFGQGEHGTHSSARCHGKAKRGQHLHEDDDNANAGHESRYHDVGRVDNESADSGHAKQHLEHSSQDNYG